MTFKEKDVKAICNFLSKKDKDIQNIIKEFGYPTIHTRKPSFETLVYIILEQQVSIASAKAAYLKLKEKIGVITPSKIFQLPEQDLKDCYFSRQKIIYVKELAVAFLEKRIVLSTLNKQSNEAIREQLITIKGIGNWTVDIYLMLCLQRSEIFPIGDIALINSIKHIKKLPKETTRETILELAKTWQPHLTIATYIFWHAYIIRKGIKL